MVNKYYIGFKEGENNDWAPLTPDGYIQMDYDLGIIKQQIDARIKTLPNEVDGYDGVDYLNVVLNDTPISMKAQAVITAIKTLDVVNNVVFVGSSYENNNRDNLKLQFSVDTILGQVEYNLSVDSKNKTISSSNS